MQVIQHNLLSQFSNRQLNITTGNRAKSAEKLSSGYRINRAADDAAGLSMSEKMRWQIRGLDRASENIEDGASLVQVADGALEETSQMIRRIRELSVQAANDTNTPSDRIQIDNEIRELKSELSRVFSDTEFNTRPIWDPNPVGKRQIGTEYQQVIDMIGSYTDIMLNNTNKAAAPSGGYQINVQGTDPNDPSTYGFTVNWHAFDGNDYSSDLIPFPANPESDFSAHLADYLPIASNPQLAGLDLEIGWASHSGATMDLIKDAIDGISYSAYISTSERVDPSGGAGVSYSVTTGYLAELMMDRDAEAFDDTCMEPKLNAEGSNVVSTPSYSDPAENAGWSFQMDVRNIGTVTAISNYTSFYSYDRSPETEGIWWGRGTNGSIYMRRYSDNEGGAGTLHSVTDTLLHEGDSEL